MISPGPALREWEYPGAEEFRTLHSELTAYFNETVEHLIANAMKSDGNDETLEQRQLPRVLPMSQSSDQKPQMTRFSAERPPARRVLHCSTSQALRHVSGIRSQKLGDGDPWDHFRR